MAYQASSPSVCTFNNRHIFKFGGLGTDGSLSAQIEKYDSQTNQWFSYELKTNLEYFMSSGVKLIWLSASC
jgi:N-acetylneuraminic acid mutarotase